ncbi:hypothetical protein ACWGH5_02730 [Streptomyces sp. NPDC054864]
MAELGAIAALLSVPVAVVAAWWNKRGAERAASAALLAGQIQADASMSVVRAQSSSEHSRRLHSSLGDASVEFLRASAALIRTVERLPSIEHDQRESLVASDALSLGAAYAPLELLAPPDLLAPAKRLLAQCRSLERLAGDRAVLRSAISALEAGWCPGDPDTCGDDHHGSAFVAWELLCQWADKDDEERWSDRDFLGYCLRTSATLSEAEVEQILALADRCPAAWPQLIGGWARDPLIERVTSHREDFVTAARAENASGAIRR